MLTNFFNSKEFTERYDMAFIYRYSPAYETGMKKRIASSIEKNPISLFDHYDLYNKIDSISWKCCRKPLKILVNLLLIKYLILLINVLRLRKILQTRKVDLLHINNGGYPGSYSALAMVLAAKLCGVQKIIFVVNNIAEGYRLPTRWLDFYFDQLVIHGVTVFVTGSCYAGDQLHTNLGVPATQITCIHNGIAHRPVTESREEVLKRLEIPQDRLVLSIIAVLEERKGHLFLLEAMKLLTMKCPEKRPPYLIIEGTGSYEEHLKNYVRDNDLSGDVKFIAHEQKIFNLINASDCIVLPSITNEDFPNIVLEAMSLGKVVIASRFSGIPEQIEDQVSGILVPPRDAEALANAIIHLSEDPDLRTSMGRMAQVRFEELFTDKRAMEHYQSFYNKILGGV